MPPAAFELLNFLCATVARKPRALPFRQGAAVARYLACLAYEVAPGPDREHLLFFSEVIWGRVFQFSKFKTATKEEAIQFLEEFARTHLATYKKESVVNAVRSSPTPKAHVPQAVLRAPSMSVTLGSGAKRRSDDLSERIYAGYWALRLAGIHAARKHVALALNHHGVQTRSRKGDTSWTSYEVAERIKQYEARVFPKKRTRDMTKARQLLKAVWEARYYPIDWVTPPYSPSNRAGGGMAQKIRPGQRARSKR